MFTWRDIPILLTGWAIILFAGLVLDASSLVLHLVTFAVIAAAASAHSIWEEIRTEGSFRLRSPRKRKAARQS